MNDWNYFIYIMITIIVIIIVISIIIIVIIVTLDITAIGIVNNIVIDVWVKSAEIPFTNMDWHWISNQMSSKEIRIHIHSQTSTIAALKLGNG